MPESVPRDPSPARPSDEPFAGPADESLAGPFAEPWQAQAFALVVSLHERGLFAWGDWAARLSGALRAQDPALGGADYYACWVAALEGLLGDLDLVPGADVDAVAASWVRAAHATPHGQPILLANDPEALEARARSEARSSEVPRRRDVEQGLERALERGPERSPGSGIQTGGPSPGSRP